MIIVEKAIKKMYRFRCNECGTILMTEPYELNIVERDCHYECPVCKQKRTIKTAYLHVRWMTEEDLKTMEKES